MKKILFIFLVSLIMGACEESIDAYEGQNGIYFDNKQTSLDTLSIAWGLKSSDIKEQTVRLRVKLFGNVVDYDRPFSVEVVSDETDTLRAKEGVDYRPFPLDYVMPANQAETFVVVTVLRTPELTKEERRLTIKLHETPELSFLYTRHQYVDSVTVRDVDIQRVIKMTEEFPIPWWWDRYGEDIFGKWSVKKSIVICDQMGIDREIWIGNLVGDFTVGFLKFAGQYMHRWLQEHPTPDEDGKPMEMGSNSQK